MMLELDFVNFSVTRFNKLICSLNEDFGLHKV